MNTKTFLSYLSFVSVMTAGLIFSMQFIDLFLPYASLSWFSFGFFNLFTLLLFYGATMSSKSENLHAFSNFFLMATMLKLFLCITIIMIYFYVLKPASHLFILPFFIVYISYTVFEVYFMSVIGKKSHHPEE